MPKHKVLIMGLPGAGKTTLGLRLAPEIGAILFDGDETRALWPDLGFRPEDRIEQARRMGALCDLANRQGFHAVAAFVCPTPESRAMFRPTFTVWIDRIQRGRFDDTNAMFIPPGGANLRLVSGTVDQWLARTIGDLYEKPDRCGASLGRARLREHLPRT